ncbi:MAG: NADH dehydrogenase (quinone) subunit D [Actinobacteria bacterium]|nr:NADH dehydrogenase (quinone) subunit D [Actinomycetota bacterium]
MSEPATSGPATSGYISSTGEPEPHGYSVEVPPLEHRPTLDELKERKARTRQNVETTGEILTVSMGPQHPSTHGVYRAVLDLDGEVVVDIRPEIGNLHRGVEKLSEERTYHQIIPITDRLDYLSSFAMNHGYCEAVEKLMGVEVPARARYIRTITSELCRLSNHIMWLGVHIMDLGTQTFFCICFRDREYILDLLEMLTGARLTHSFCRIGGVAKDLPDGFAHKCRKVVEFLPKRVAEYERIVKQNRIYYRRAKNVGIFTSEDCFAWRVTGPPLRAAGVVRDLRKDEPYAAYDEVNFDVAVEYNADVYDRFLVRMKEIRESCKIIEQCLDNLPDGPFLAKDSVHTMQLKKNVMRDAGAMIHDFYQVFHGPDAPKGEVYRATEVPKGEFGVYIRSDGGTKPARIHFTTPSFYHGQVLPAMARGEMLADVVAIFASIDVVLGDCDR